ncbi:MAG TPA: metallophosphoesterase [Victivallales bacterium]|nr:metallophosphoesterase [Victivallales bacterium]
MKKIIATSFITSIFILAWTFNLKAVSNINKKLKFNKDGLFNIVQITDTHIDFCDEPNTYQNKWKWTENTYNELKDMLINLKKAAPGGNIDLIVFTGDIVTQMPNYMNETPKYKGWANVFPQLKYIWTGKNKDGKKIYTHGLIDLTDEKEIMYDSKPVPWTFAIGNHDIENNYTKEKCREYFNFLAGLNNSFVPLFDKNNNDELTPGNYLVPVYDDSNHKSAVLYFINTWDGGFTSIPKTKGKTIVNWLKINSTSYNYPSLLFMHIPDLWKNKKAVYKTLGSELVYNPRIKVYNKKLKKKKDIGGSWYYNDLVSANENDGGHFYNTIVKSDNIMGVFSGHDHYNHFSGFTKDGVAICYGLKTLSNWWANLGNGARLITLQKGKKQFTTSKFYYIDSSSYGLSGKIKYDFANKTFTTLPSDSGNELSWANKFYDKYFKEWSAKGKKVDRFSIQIINKTDSIITVNNKTIASNKNCFFTFNNIIPLKAVSLTIEKRNKTVLGNIKLTTPNSSSDKSSPDKISVSEPGCNNGNRENGYMRGFDVAWTMDNNYAISINNAKIKTVGKNKYEGYAVILISKSVNN